jgi:hypothetical protein
VFRREESERQARTKAQAERQLVERAEVARIMMLNQEAHAKAAIVDQDKRSAATKEAVTYLQLCVGGDPDCTVSSVALALKGMTMASVEGVLGAPREQKIGDTKFYYYPIRLKSGLNTLQVQYEIDRTRVSTGGQVGNVVSEVNY